MFLKKIYYLLPRFIRNFIQIIANKLTFDAIDDFINEPYGIDYGLTRSDRMVIYQRVLKILRNIDSGTSVQSLLTVIKSILSLPPEQKGCIVECGCYLGASTAALSIAASITKRKFYVYDSFEGLPDIETKNARIYPHLKVYGYYKKGMYEADYNQVKLNVELFGEISNVKFVKGLFDDTLINHKDALCFLFMDVDLTSSTKSCIKHLWPKIIDNSYVYTDDACDLEIAKIWFDKNWWNENLNEEPPGYVGSGCGLPISGYYSALGYTIKNVDKNKLKKIYWMSYS